MRTRYINWVIPVLFTFLFVGCNSREIREVRKLYHKRISFDVPLLVVDSLSVFDDAEFILKNKAKIVTYSDNYSCETCISNWLKIWNMVSDNKLLDTELVIIIPNNNPNGVQQLLQKYHLPNKILLDKDNTFLKKNGLENLLARNRTFLLDKKNNIILVGEPFNHPELMDLYSSTITRLLNE